MSWAEDELKTTNLGDRRREHRLLTIVEDLIAQPNASVLQASRDDAAVQGLYKFWSNRRIPPAAILSGHIDQTVERCRNNSKLKMQNAKLRIVAIRDGQSVRYYGTDV